MESRSPFFSIITPSYNRAHFLPEVIKSVQAQTFGNYEHIIVDDGSSDETEKVVRSFSADDERIAYIKQENHGRSHARNVGINRATGDYVCFLDSDDRWSESYLRNIKETITTSKSEFIATRMVWVSEVSKRQTQRQIESVYPSEIQKIISLQIGMNVCLSRALFKEERFNENLEINEDFELWTRIVCKYNSPIIAAEKSHYLVTTPEEVGKLSDSEITGILKTQELIRTNRCVQQTVASSFWKIRTRNLEYRFIRNAIEQGNRYHCAKLILRYLFKYPNNSMYKSLSVALLYSIIGGKYFRRLQENV